MSRNKLRERCAKKEGITIEPSIENNEEVQKLFSTFRNAPITVLDKADIALDNPIPRIEKEIAELKTRTTKHRRTSVKIKL